MAESSSREGRTFPVETRFQKLARRPGGLPRAQAIEAAQAKIEESKPEFETWLGRRPLRKGSERGCEGAAVG
jgi:hypothetical protein